MKISFKELINEEQPVLIDFYAEWCGPCKAMTPILEEVVSAVEGAARVVKIDVDKNRKLAEQYQINGVPTFILFQNGKATWRQSGMQSAHRLIEVIREAI